MTAGTSKRLRIGYVPLTDAAVLVAAAERGFAEDEGLHLELVREVSWANIRDKLILGLFDAAHMLAPFAIATSLGLGHVKVPLAVPFALNLNGNAITVSLPLFLEMSSLFGREPTDAGESAQALGAVVRQRRRDHQPPLTFGIVFPFSTHTYLLRHWLRLAGVDPEHDVQLVVVPPPYMAESLNSGLLQGFCVGSPWNSLAVEEGAGHIVALGVEIAARAPEKVLALPQSFVEAEPDVSRRLIRALRKAAGWCEARENHGALAQLLSDPRHLSLPAAIIRDTLDGNLKVGGGRRHANPDFILLGRDGINRPDPRHAVWLYAEMAHAGQTIFSAESAQAAASVYRSDLYDDAIGEPAADISSDPVGLAQGPAFSSGNPQAYLGALKRHSSVS